MDKLIEVLAGKRATSLIIVFFIAFSFLPSLFLIFIWDREFFCDIDLWKLVLLSASIGTIFLFLNYFIMCFVDGLYVWFKRREDGVTEVDDDEPGNLFYYLMSLVLSVIEVLILAGMKCLIPSLTIGKILGKGILAFVVILVICLVLDLIIFLKKKKRAKDN